MVARGLDVTTAAGSVFITSFPVVISDTGIGIKDFLTINEDIYVGISGGFVCFPLKTRHGYVELHIKPASMLKRCYVQILGILQLPVTLFAAGCLEQRCLDTFKGDVATIISMFKLGIIATSLDGQVMAVVIVFNIDGKWRFTALSEGPSSVHQLVIILDIISFSVRTLFFPPIKYSPS